MNVKRAGRFLSLVTLSLFPHLVSPRLVVTLPRAFGSRDGSEERVMCDRYAPFTSYSFRSPPAHLHLRFGSPSVPVTMMR